MARRWLRDLGKERLWRRMVARQRRSGLTIRGFCRQQQLSEPNFYAWRRAIAQRNRERRGEHLPPPSPRMGRSSRQPSSAPAAAAKPCFVPIALADEAARTARGALAEASPAWAGVEIVLLCGRRLRVEPGFDRSTLRDVLEVLAGGGPC